MAKPPVNAAKFLNHETDHNAPADGGTALPHGPDALRARSRPYFQTSYTGFIFARSFAFFAQLSEAISGRLQYLQLRGHTPARGRPGTCERVRYRRAPSSDGKTAIHQSVRS
jgi:hypothetical protein